MKNTKTIGESGSVSITAGKILMLYQIWQGLGPEQAALAQSQHFDQLKALWNRKSPPRTRRHMQVSKMI